MVTGCGQGDPAASPTTAKAGIAGASSSSSQAPIQSNASQAPVPADQTLASAPPQADTAPVPAASAPIACSSDIGESAAAALVSQCVAVSPATHPPCNAANSCAMIRNEIARSCALIGDDAKNTAQCRYEPTSRAAAADMVQRYYAAINAHDYASAYELWGPNGGASGKTLPQFSAGFAQTVRTNVTVGAVSPVEGAAGSLYVTVPVKIDAQRTDGTRQRFAGTYTLRQVNRGMGLSQGWHIASAALRPA
ncbi:hypothetical protein ASE49_06880 [Novosphingobium sp. Leaf2]|nr:hypothetical protein ASE49_06880 [Novosphingobium sp. Leaf2]